MSLIPRGMVYCASLICVVILGVRSLEFLRVQNVIDYIRTPVNDRQDQILRITVRLRGQLRKLVQSRLPTLKHYRHHSPSRTLPKSFKVKSASLHPDQVTPVPEIPVHKILRPDRRFPDRELSHQVPQRERLTRFLIQNFHSVLLQQIESLVRVQNDSVACERAERFLA